MVTALLSPCLYIENNEIKNLTQLFEVLDFTNSFLDVKLGFSTSSILAIENWFSFPQYKQSIYNQFSTLIVPLLKKYYVIIHLMNFQMMILIIKFLTKNILLQMLKSLITCYNIFYVLKQMRNIYYLWGNLI